METHLRYSHPEKFQELQAIERKNAPKVKGWSLEEDMALRRGLKKSGQNWRIILEQEKEILGHRTAKSIKSRYDYLRLVNQTSTK